MSDRERLQGWLDGAEAVATTFYVLLLAIVVGAILGGLYYVSQHWPIQWGSQGEGFYLAAAFLLVIGWAMGQLAWLIKRRRRRSGLTVRFGEPDQGDVSAGPSTFRWSTTINAAPVQTFRIDQAMIDQARAARTAGMAWEDICQQINPDWSTMNTFERALFVKAIEAAVQNS